LQPKGGIQLHVEDLAEHVAEPSASKADVDELLPGYQTLAGNHQLPTDGERFKVLVETRLAQLFPLP
jgi:hypothetical protein